MKTHLPTLWIEALGDNNREEWISDWALSSIWSDNPVREDIPRDRIDQLGRIWDAAHMDVKSICRAAHLTQAALAARFGIPKRTVENWCSGANKCPDYTRRMMCECLGLLEK